MAGSGLTRQQQHDITAGLWIDRAVSYRRWIHLSLITQFFTVRSSYPKPSKSVTVASQCFMVEFWASFGRDHARRLAEDHRAQVGV